jgi:hypothetical protein
MNGTEYMFVGKKVIKAQVFDRSRKSTNCGGIASKLDLGVHDANLHEPQPFTGESQVPAITPGQQQQSNVADRHVWGRGAGQYAGSRGSCDWLAGCNQDG